MYQKKREAIEPCPLKYVFNLFGKKWNAWIYCSLVNNPSLRYTELKDILPDITDSALSAALKMFMKNDIIRRTSYDEIPPRVEYSLTDKGRSAVPFLQGLCNWSSSYNSGNPEYQMTHCSYCKFNKKL